jgi:hypothetical protein
MKMPAKTPRKAKPENKVFKAPNVSPNVPAPSGDPNPIHFTTGIVALHRITIAPAITQKYQGMIGSFFILDEAPSCNGRQAMD